MTPSFEGADRASSLREGDISGALAVDFPPRQEPLAFRKDLESKYRDGLHRGATTTFVDLEGDIVWTQEYLRYRVNRCDHSDAVSRVFQQIDGRGVQPVCGVSASATFPPRNEPFDFRLQLEGKYRDGLRRSSTTTFVDIEGDIVWVQEYLRYRVSSCSHTEAESKVFAQIDGRGVQADCQPPAPRVVPSPAPAPTPTPTPAPTPPPAPTPAPPGSQIGPPFIVSGQVTNGSGVGVANASVRVLDGSSVVVSSQTDAGGRYRLTMSSGGLFTLTVAVSGYQTGSRSLLLLPGVPTTGFDSFNVTLTAASVPLPNLACTPIAAGTLTVTVINTSGSSFQVAFSGPTSKTVTVAAGASQVTSLTPGQYQITATAAGAIPAVSSYSLTSGCGYSLTLSLR